MSPLRREDSAVGGSKRTLKLAILKGNRLNAWHLAMYACAARLSPPESPLEITAFVPPDNLFETGSLQTPLVGVPYEFEAGPRWRRLQARWRYRRLHERAGYEFFPYGLEKLLEGFDLIQTWETFAAHSRAAVRAAAFGRIPPGLYHDEAYNGLDALRVLDGDLSLFFSANNGREPAFIYLIGISVGMLGRSPFAVRLAVEG